MAFSASAFAADAPASGAMSSQQTKMGTCNKEATGKTGADRKAFMKTCLSGSGTAMAAPAGPMTQQTKMKKCNVDATGKKGDERKAFMKSCLSA
ncbi:MAG: PsiF family protein [Pseudomonadota bacterium]|nr:PsiF family protein [Pseudomonadota bacterium]